MLEELIVSLNSLIENQNAPDNQEYLSYIAFFKDFLNKYPLDDLTKLKDITYQELLMAFLLARNPESFSKIKNIIEKYDKVLAKIRNFDFVSSLTFYYNDKKVKEFVDLIIAKQDIKTLFCYAFDLSTKIPNCDNLGSLYAINLASVFNRYPQMIEDLSFLKGISFDEAKNFYDTTLIIKKLKRRIKILNKNPNDLIVPILKTFLTTISNYLNKCELEYKKREKRIEKLKRNAEELIKQLSISSEITNIDYLLSLFDEDDIKERICDYVIAHNNALYASLEKDYERTKLVNLKSLVILFNKYNYDYLSINEEARGRIEALSYLDIETILIWLRKYNIEIDLNLIPLIMLPKLEVLDELLTKNLITPEFIQNNIVLLENNDLLNIVIKNIALLNAKGLNILNYHNSLDVLLNPNLASSLAILSLYLLNISKETKDISFLNSIDLIAKIELIMEMGYLDLTSLDILNKSFEELYKLKILKMLDIPYHNLKNITFADYYFVPSSLFSIPLNPNNNIILPNFLNSYQVSSQVLLINGIYVSKVKLEENLKKIGANDSLAIFYAIIMDSFYTFPEIEALKDALIPENIDLYNLISKELIL